MSKRTAIRHAIGIALEGLSGELLEWVVLAKQKDAMRKHVIRFVFDYALTHGLTLTAEDITAELDAIVRELKHGAPLGSSCARPVRTGYVDGADVYHPSPDMKSFDAHADKCEPCAAERRDPDHSGYRPGGAS
jgi:hypothetical protein